MFKLLWKAITFPKRFFLQRLMKRDRRIYKRYTFEQQAIYWTKLVETKQIKGDNDFIMDMAETCAESKAREWERINTKYY
jgi:hypothetical protein